MNTDNLTAEVCEVALGYLRAGIVPIPIKLDGSKSPDIAEWKRFQNSAPTPWVVRQWFSRPAGIAIVCGAASHGIEVIDFDQWETFEPWRSLIRPSLFSKLVVVETGGGGFHVIYRCREITGNKKLASWESPDCISHKLAGTRRGCNGQPIKPTRIESKGEGGYIIAAGSPLTVHLSGQPYAQMLGPPMPQVNVISPEERKELWVAAAEFDCQPRKSQKVEQARRQILSERYKAKNQSRPAGDVTPWDDFDRRGSWSDVLSPHGWTQFAENHWTRPGKDFGTSASVGLNGDRIEILTVFSTSAEPLNVGSYGKFRAFTALNHGGDGRAAAKELVKLGYGNHSHSDVDLSGILGRDGR